MVVAPRVGALALVLQNCEDGGFLYALCSHLPASGMGQRRGLLWMTTTIPETPIWGKTPETHLCGWPATGALPNPPRHGRPNKTAQEYSLCLRILHNYRPLAPR